MAGPDRNKAVYTFDENAMRQIVQSVRRLQRQVINLEHRLPRHYQSDFSKSSKSTIASFWFPSDDTNNYLFPAEFLGERTAYGYKVDYGSAGQNGLTNGDTTRYTICNPVGISWCMPGDTVLCWLNPEAKWTSGTASEAWEPFPGQGLMRPARVKKDIPARDFVSGSNIFLTAPGGSEILELSSISVSHTWCTSDVEIKATPSDPMDVWIYFASKNSNGYEYFIVARECNPTNL